MIINGIVFSPLNYTWIILGIQGERYSDIVIRRGNKKNIYFDKKYTLNISYT